MKAEQIGDPETTPWVDFITFSLFQGKKKGSDNIDVDQKVGWAWWLTPVIPAL